MVDRNARQPSQECPQGDPKRTPDGLFKLLLSERGIAYSKEHCQPCHHHTTVQAARTCIASASDAAPDFATVCWPAAKDT